MPRQNDTKPFEEILEIFVSRRRFLKTVSTVGLSASGLAACAKPQTSNTPPGSDSKTQPKSLSFNELSQSLDDKLSVPDDYLSQVLLRWGDPIFDSVPEFDPYNQTLEQQLGSFGFNNDYVGFVPLPLGSEQSEHGLLAVNHEYSSPELMFPGGPGNNKLSKAQTDIDIAAHGMSVVEVKKNGDAWELVKNSKYNRRITPNTPLVMTGPAAGSDRLKTIFSDDGVHTLGTYANCAGGITPWGTVLTGEENVDGHFKGDYRLTPEKENYERFGIKNQFKHWADFYDRWHLQKNPNELMHAGWIVEVDPYDPLSKPKKRTALGRFKHEGCNLTINNSGHVVAYSGDDQIFEYVYKFVSKNRFDPTDRAKNMDLLDEGTLYVARFNESGTLSWLPLVYGVGPLTEKNGFKSQADICLDTRKAADLVGATPMDRPEDVEVNPKNGRVYAMLTNNSARKASQVDSANPRPHNGHGQIIEFWPEDGDHTQETFNWSLFILAGKPGENVTLYHPDNSENGYFSSPDNCAFDSLGNLWIATDGTEKQLGNAEGLWACEVDGPQKALTKRFMRIPVGAELCGPFITADDQNLFCAVQHPGSGSTFENPTTRWPDYNEKLPPRPAVVVVTKKGGGRIGS